MRHVSAEEDGGVGGDEGDADLGGGLLLQAPVLAPHLHVDLQQEVGEELGAPPGGGGETNETGVENEEGIEEKEMSVRRVEIFFLFLFARYAREG